MDYQCVVVYTIVSIATPEEDVETISQRNGCLGCVTGLVKKLSIVTSARRCNISLEFPRTCYVFLLLLRFVSWLTIKNFCLYCMKVHFFY